MSTRKYKNKKINKENKTNVERSILKFFLIYLFIFLEIVRPNQRSTHTNIPHFNCCMCVCVFYF